jgi:prolyl-tRNA synthetase
MHITKLIGRRSKEFPREAVLVSQQFLSRGAYFRQIQPKTPLLLPSGQLAVAEIEKIIHRETAALNGQEIRVSTKDDWLSNKAILQNLSHEFDSHRQLPACLYSVAHNFCTEPEIKGGLLQMHNFTEARFYGFFTDQKSRDEFYEKLSQAFQNIFRHCGLENILQVTAEKNSQGKLCGHEFIQIHPAGQSLIVSNANKEVSQNRNIAVAAYNYPAEEALELTEVATPDCPTIENLAEFLQIPATRTGKIVLLEHPVEHKLIVVFLRGDRQMNEFAVKRFLGLPELPFASDNLIYAAGICPGYGSLYNIDLSKVILLVDNSIINNPNLVIGANKAGYHLCNFNFQRDLNCGHIGDFSLIQDTDSLSGSEEKATLTNGIILAETAIFNPGLKESVKATYTNDSGKTQPMWLLSGRIGIDTLLPSIIEEHHDRFGPIWPKEVAPFQVQLCILDANQEAVKQSGQQIYQLLQANNISALIDDREIRAGIMFAEADLIGAPLRLIVSAKTTAEQKFELSRRGEKEKKLCRINELLSIIKELN